MGDMAGGRGEEDTGIFFLKTTSSNFFSFFLVCYYHYDYYFFTLETGVQRLSSIQVLKMFS